MIFAYRPAIGPDQVGGFEGSETYVMPVDRRTPARKAETEGGFHSAGMIARFGTEEEPYIVSHQRCSGKAGRAEREWGVQ